MGERGSSATLLSFSITYLCNSIIYFFFFLSQLVKPVFDTHIPFLFYSLFLLLTYHHPLDNDSINSLLSDIRTHTYDDEDFLVTLIATQRLSNKIKA